MIKISVLTLITLLLFSCQHIETGDSLDKSTIKHIKSLGLLDDNEKIISYYSNLTKKKAGNFFTDKRIAHYWLDGEPAESDTTFAYYKDIVSIDTIYSVPDTFIPYMQITKTDSSQFQVFIEGTHEEVKKFFEEAIKRWKQNKN